MLEEMQSRPEPRLRLVGAVEPPLPFASPIIRDEFIDVP